MVFSNTYTGLGERFYEKSQPTPVQKPQLFLWDAQLAEQLKIATDLQQDPDALAQIFSGNRILPGSEPIAIAYAGHQFGYFSAQLGDGRAHLLGEVIDRVGKTWDVQLKGTGPTSFSRGGDGRLALGPAVREFIMSEAMHALGVPTTRSLAVVATGEPVYRDRPMAGAVVTRIASSHLRVGTFEFFAARDDRASLKALRDYAIEHHFPDLKEVKENRTVLLLDKVIETQIQLVVQWMRVGFIHGVMNTDNTTISGETIDFGPCAMMGVYDQDTVYSSIDRTGRYAFGNQPQIAHWNMARFAECLLVLVDSEDTQTTEQLTAMVNGCPGRFEREYCKMMGRKFGLLGLREEDDELLNSLLEQFSLQGMDYTITFDLLTKSLNLDSVTSELKTEFGQYFGLWRKRINDQDAPIGEIQKLMRQNNPVVIPRNHHVERVIQECEETGVATAAEKFLQVLNCPYEEIPQTCQYQDKPGDGDQHYQTFCGT
ncbi:MAG: YdiU family protein [Gammaproteobacteria bacterium]|jgi:uncharacterized protein YdiU (UPF0061 family)|nr:hypothetical protein [Gammaproteobacteria bacterium]MDP6096109.1 YdiU family protein [Gammaproteobacteria bacterium]HJO11713.1 YdiU family protein [Gammaproteobacteria bacterium]